MDNNLSINPSSNDVLQIDYCLTQPMQESTFNSRKGTYEACVNNPAGSSCRSVARNGSSLAKWGLARERLYRSWQETHQGVNGIPTPTRQCNRRVATLGTIG